MHVQGIKEGTLSPAVCALGAMGERSTLLVLLEPPRVMDQTRQQSDDRKCWAC